MLLKFSKMVNEYECENLYIKEIYNCLKDKLDDSYNFIVARTNTPQEVQQFKEDIITSKKNILLFKSDEIGIIPPFLDDLFLVFRTYNNTNLVDYKKIFPIPCGYATSFDYSYNNSIYDRKEKKNLINREYDFFFSGQMSPERNEMVNILNSIKNKYNCIVNSTDKFASGYILNDYYDLLSNSKIAFVPKGVVIPESFRYFEGFECNCIVITTLPHNDLYNIWYYEKSPAIFLNNWNELTEDLINKLLVKDNLENYELLNKEYFNNYISTKAVSNYILEKINSIT